MPMRSRSAPEPRSSWLWLLCAAAIADLLKLEKANFDALIEHLPGLACIVGPNQKLVRWNSRFQNFWATPPPIGAMPAVQCLAEDYRELVPAVMGRAWEAGHAEMEAAWLTKSGVRIPCYITGIRVLVSKQPCILSVGIDISDKKRAEEALRKSEEQYRRLLTNLPDVAWTSNLTGQITYVSPNVHQVFGQTAAAGLPRWNRGPDPAYPS